MWEEAWLDPTTAKVTSEEAQVTCPEGTEDRDRDGTGLWAVEVWDTGTEAGGLRPQCWGQWGPQEC